jgi:hypothetical protein
VVSPVSALFALPGLAMKRALLLACWSLSHETHCAAGLDVCTASQVRIPTGGDPVHAGDVHHASHDAVASPED